MTKALVLAAVLAGLSGLGRLLGSRVQNIDWEKRIAALPDNAPPKWMFRNVTAIRENTPRPPSPLRRRLRNKFTERQQGISPRRRRGLLSCRRGYRTGIASSRPR